MQNIQLTRYDLIRQYGDYLNHLLYIEKSFNDFISSNAHYAIPQNQYYRIEEMVNKGETPLIKLVKNHMYIFDFHIMTMVEELKYAFSLEKEGFTMKSDFQYDNSGFALLMKYNRNGRNGFVLNGVLKTKWDSFDEKFKKLITSDYMKRETESRKVKTKLFYNKKKDSTVMVTTMDEFKRGIKVVFD